MFNMEVEKFTDYDKSEYSRLKSQAKQGWLLFAEAIVKIRNSKLYKLEYSTFEEFCSSELGIGKSTAYQLLAGVETMHILQKSAMADILPNSERQARPLTKLEPPLQVETWSEVAKENMPEEITAKKIAEKVAEKKELNEIYKQVKKEQPENPTILVPVPLSEKEILAKAREISKRKNAERKKQIQEVKERIETESLKEVNGLFDVIVIDPPWQYEANIEKNSYDSNGRRVANPYPEMSFEQIKQIEIPAKENAIIWLWTTHKYLEKSFDLLEEWGFEHKATLVWNKERIGMGSWLRMQVEFCHLAIKGKPFWHNTTKRDIICEARRQHSRKPESFYEMVDELCVGRKIDYFAREQRKGWETFGSETNKY